MSAASWPPLLAIGAGEVERLAMKRWREREAAFPPFARRDPDALDLATGAWSLCLAGAAREAATEGVRK